MAIEIRPARAWADYLACEEIQRQVWAAPDNRDVVPASLLITAHKNGGILLGAFDQEQMVAFVFGFVGTEGEGPNRRYKHCSHELAVLPQYRGTGLAVRLKQRQRELVLAQGLDLMTWTYDPLQAANARLNLSRLGAVARRYLRNAYGEMYDVLNAGVASDRFEVEWLVKSNRVQDRMTASVLPQGLPEGIPPAFQVEFDVRGLPRVVQIRPESVESVWVEIPADFNRIRELDPGLAVAWREWTAQALERRFGQGYAAVEAFVWRDSAGQARASYLLKQVGVTDVDS